MAAIPGPSKAGGSTPLEHPTANSNGRIRSSRKAEDSDDRNHDKQFDESERGWGGKALGSLWGEGALSRKGAFEGVHAKPFG